MSINSVLEKYFKNEAEKFEQKDVKVNLQKVPDEIKIYNSKGLNSFRLVVFSFCTILGIVLLIIDQSQYIWLFLFIAVSGYFTFLEIKKSKDKRVQLRINNNGFETVATGFHNWASVSNVGIETEGFLEQECYYLVFNHDNKSEKILIDDFEITKKEMQRLLEIYRGRANDKIMN